ncbi:MAG: BMP family ABC transporter substrate-binding protein [Propionibacteriales bacterium]|nr:BMP family ABC transporter substrate-binding protein [Propionibacteriales bacterium]
MRRVTTFAATMLAGALALTACGGSDTSASNSTKKPSSGGSSSSSEQTLKVGLAYDIGGRGDQSFNDLAAAGLDKVKSDLKLETKELAATAGETDADKQTRLELLAKGGFNPIIAVGFAYATALGKVAPQYPDTKFAIIDSVVDAPNVTGLTFAEEQGSFLVGAAAALKTKSNNVGFIGGCLVPLLQKFEAGYVAGVHKVDPSIKVQVKYLSTPAGNCTGFNDPAAGKETANGMYDNNADIIYTAAGGSGKGAFEAAKAKGQLGIGVDSDQYNQEPLADVKEVIMTSALKRVDTAVFEYVESVAKGDPLTGVQVFDLERNGVGYSTSGGQVDDIKSKLDDYRQQIIDGKIKIPTKP